MKEFTLEEFRLKYGENIVFDEKGVADLGYGYYAKLEGEKVKISGKFLTVFEKQIDGSWKIARDIFNYNAPH